VVEKRKTKKRGSKKGPSGGDTKLMDTTTCQIVKGEGALERKYVTKDVKKGK